MDSVDLTPEGLAANIKDLATLPDVALRIARMVEDPTSSATDIGREISNDAALTARLLRIANSPAFGQHGKINTISECIQFHHEPDQARTCPMEVATVHIANSAAVLAEIGSTDLTDAPAISPAALRTAKLDSTSVVEIVLQTQASAQDILPLLIAARPAPATAALRGM